MASESQLPKEPQTSKSYLREEASHFGPQKPQYSPKKYIKKCQILPLT